MTTVMWCFTKDPSASRLKYRKMASATRRAANRYYKRGIRHFSEDVEMVEMYKDDRKMLREFARLVHDGYITAAQDMIMCMDTAVYEVIPARTYNYVYNRD